MNDPAKAIVLVSKIAAELPTVVDVDALAYAVTVADELLPTLAATVTAQREVIGALVAALEPFVTLDHDGCCNVRGEAAGYGCGGQGGPGGPNTPSNIAPCTCIRSRARAALERAREMP